MESIIENYSMAESQLSKNEISRLYRNLEKYNDEIEDIKRKLADFEGQLERFQPKIKEMDEMYKLHKPQRNFHTYNQSKEYNDYQDYVKEKDRLERNIQNYKDILEERYEEKRRLEEMITIHNGNMFFNASKVDNRPSSQKSQKYESTSISNLSKQGPDFHGIFTGIINSFQGHPSAERMDKVKKDGGRKTRKRTRRRKNK
jgi:chromosome segregation ATPase